MDDLRKFFYIGSRILIAIISVFVLIDYIANKQSPSNFVLFIMILTLLTPEPK